MLLETVIYHPLKHPLWISAFIFAVPAIAVNLQWRPQVHRLYLWLMVFFMGLSTTNLGVELFFVRYRGSDCGFGVTVSDFFFFGYLLWLLLWPKNVRQWWPKNMGLMWVFLALAVLSLLESPVPYYGLFSIHKLLRCMVLYWVAVNVTRDHRDIETIVSAFTWSVLVQGAVVLSEKYLSSVYRVQGTMPHPNTLGMYLNAILPILLCLVFTIESRSKRAWYGVALLGGMLCVTFTRSRGSLAVMIGVLAMCAGLSLLLQPTWHKVKLFAAGLCLVTVLGIKAAPAVIDRFLEAPEVSEESREHFNEAAMAMADDHFWGVGINAYNQSLVEPRYYWYLYPKVEFDQRVDFVKTAQAQVEVANCHNIYLLWAAECGWIATAVFAILILRFYLANIAAVFTCKDVYYTAVLIGLLGGMTTIHLQGFLEWIYRQTPVIYQFHLFCGMLIAIIYNCKETVNTPASQPGWKEGCGPSQLPGLMIRKEGPEPAQRVRKTSIDRTTRRE